MNRILTYSIIIGFCLLISYISINGTNQIANRSVVGTISYKAPDTWNINRSEKQFRLLEITLDTKEDFSLVVFSNIQGTTDQNIQRWIGQFKKDELLEALVLRQRVPPLGRLLLQADRDLAVVAEPLRLLLVDLGEERQVLELVRRRVDGALEAEEALAQRHLRVLRVEHLELDEHLLLALRPVQRRRLRLRHGAALRAGLPVRVMFHAARMAPRTTKQ